MVFAIKITSVKLRVYSQLRVSFDLVFTLNITVVTSVKLRVFAIKIGVVTSVKLRV